MKTNHQRQYKSTHDPRAVFTSYYVGGNSRRLELSGRKVSACATCGDHTNGKRGIAKDKRGAKKFVNSRARFHERQALAKIVRRGEMFNMGLGQSAAENEPAAID
jgi:hypothetical protein